MGEREPVVKTLNATEARQQWSGLLNEVFKGETRIVVEKSGIPVAAIVFAEDLARMSDPKPINSHAESTTIPILPQPVRG